MTTPHLRNSINPLPWRYGFFLIALVCLALSPTTNSAYAGTVTLRSRFVFSGDPISIQSSAQGSQEDRHQPVIIIFDPPGAGTGRFPGHLVARPQPGGDDYGIVQ
jgi:hypothetical protein